MAKLGRAPEDSEVAKAAKLPLKQVREVREAARAVTSLDRPVADSETSLGELMSGEEAGPGPPVSPRFPRFIGATSSRGPGPVEILPSVRGKPCRARRSTGAGDDLERPREMRGVHHLPPEAERVDAAAAVLEKSVLHAAQAPCLGLGLEIAASCDFRLAAETAADRRFQHRRHP